MNLPAGVPDAGGHTDDPTRNSGRMQACRQPTVTLSRVELQTRLDRNPREIVEGAWAAGRPGLQLRLCSLLRGLG